MNKDKELRILFAGGGTGGHIFPIIAVARELKKQAREQGIDNLHLFFLGPNGFAKKQLEEEGITVQHVPAGKLHRFFTWRLILELPKFIAGFFVSLWKVWNIMPDATWSKGGFGAFMPSLVTWLYHEPLILHDSDSIPGLANRLLRYPAARIGISFPSAADYFASRKTATVGNPIRESLLAETPPSAINFNTDKPKITILGGSQGANSINELAAQILQELLQKYEITHQAGSNNLDGYKKMLQEIYGIDPETSGYHLFGFLSEREMAHALHSADLIISRAGANSIYEIAATGKPAILVPLPGSAGDHQKKNAFDYARFGAARVLEAANLKPHLLSNEIYRILSDEEIEQKMSKAAKNFAKEDSAYVITREILEIAVM